MQILRQFGELSPDLIDMQRYAAWKAADIRKALREGRTPTAGPSESAANAEQELLDELGLPSVPGMLCSSTVCTAMRCTPPAMGLLLWVNRAAPMGACSITGMCCGV